METDDKQVIRPRYKEIAGEALAEKKGATQKVQEFAEDIKEKEEEIKINYEKYLQLTRKYSDVTNKYKKLIISIERKDNHWKRELNRMNGLLETNREKRQEYYRLNMFLKTRLAEITKELNSRTGEVMVLKSHVNSRLVILISKCECLIIGAYKRLKEFIKRSIIKLQIKIQDVKSKHNNPNKK